MRTWYFILLLAILGGCTHKTPSVVTGFEGKPLPAFNLLQMDSVTHFNTTKIPTGKPTVIFLFSPYCSYCRAQTEDMAKNAEKIKNIQIYMLSEFPVATLKDYSDQYHLNRYPNITVMQDYEAYFAKYYKAPAVPFIAIYNSDKTLKEVLLGNVGVESIKEVVLK